MPVEQFGDTVVMTEDTDYLGQGVSYPRTLRIDAGATTSPCQISVPNHGLASGNAVTISGAGDSSANSTWSVTVLDANTFTIPLDNTGGAGWIYSGKVVPWNCSGCRHVEIDTIRLEGITAGETYQLCAGSATGDVLFEYVAPATIVDTSYWTDCSIQTPVPVWFVQPECSTARCVITVR